MRYIGFLTIVSLAGCITVGPDYDSPQPDGVQEAFVAADEAVYEDAGSEAEPWWRAFDDPVLDRLVTMARAENRDLLEAVARVEAAAARTRAAYRGLLPQGGVSGSVLRQQNSVAAFAAFAGPDAVAGGQQDGDGQGGQDGGQDPGGGGAPAQPTFELYQLAADLSWELDLFGRIRSQARQQLANAEAQAAFAEDTARIVTARTAEAYFTYLEAVARAEVAASNLETQEEGLRLTEALFELGEVSEFDLARQRTVTRSTAAGLERLRASRGQAASALALLTGNTVPGLAEAVPALTAPDGLPTVAEEIVLSDPTAVLRRRPDVEQAERQLASASYGINVQTAQLFPQVTLTGNANLQALSAGGLSDDGAFGFSYGPRLSWNVFSYPQLLAQVDAADAEAKAALYAYQRAVLSALTETDEALVAYARALDRAALLAEAQESAARALFLAEVRYREGADSLLAFLDAQRTALQTEDEFVIARAEALRARVAVHRALAD
jgi:NodT family efflux transporter outer membrane factor (OMF) lipoprotein